MTIVMSASRITALGADVPIPAGAREIDGDGLFAYAGFVDAFTRSGVSEAKASAADERRVEDEFESVSEGPRVATEAANRNGIFPRRRVEELLDVQEQTYRDARAAGFVAALVAPPQAVLGGQAALLALDDRPLRRSLLALGVGQTASFVPPTPRSLLARDRYPATTFGVITHFRQALLDAQWYRDLKGYSAKHAEARDRIPFDRDLDALQDVLSGRVPLLWEADDFEEINRVLDLAQEFKFKPIIVGGRDAFRVSSRLASTKTPVVLSLKVPKKPEAFAFDAAAMLDEWRNASAGAGERPSLPKAWQKRPFLPASAYAAANQLRESELHCAAELEKAGVTWCVSTLGLTKPIDALGVMREMIECGLSADAALKALTSTPSALLAPDCGLGSIAVGQRASLSLFSKPFEDRAAELRLTVIDGAIFQPETDIGDSQRGPRGDRRKRDGKGGPDRESPDAASKPASAPASAAASASAPAPATPLESVLCHSPSWPIETTADRSAGIQTHGNVLLTGARVLTISGDDLPSASILIENGKIKAIGDKLSAPAGVATIDLAGFVVMPGIIDPHSHIALDSVNEFSLSVVPEVRCEDVVRSDDIDIFRALAGGCTTIHAMHGSANTIGGQCVLLKLKWGRPAQEMILHDRLRTVKFATGENVKRSGQPSRGGGGGADRIRRFPGTRMGVETVMRRALQAGREYDRERREFDAASKSGKEPLPLRRDLRLEALADIVSGVIAINCHCYRADEILRLLNVAEDFGVRVAALHHCLEAYRIMPEIRRHGASTATFADWWAYKVEAYDAVPQNAGMLLRGGVNSTLKSDSADLMRHMPLEAAKSVRFSGLSSREALRLITLNAARAFALEKRLGSIEVGKDADLAVFDGHPLDTFSKCVLTLIDGEVYFRHRDFALPTAQRSAGAADAGAIRPRAAISFETDATPASGASLAPRVDSGTSVVPVSTAYAITEATIHPVSGPAITGGTLLIRDGRIEAIGRGLASAKDVTLIDARGLHVWPGVINAASTVGMHEIGAVDVSIDTSDSGMYMPDLCAVSALNPHSAMIGVARAAGITTSLLAPGGGRVAGQAGLIRLNGWTAAEMVLDSKMGLVVSLPRRSVDPVLDRKARPDPEKEFEESRAKQKEDEQAARMLLELDRFFRDALLVAKRPASDSAPAADPRFEAMRPYVLGQKPVLFDAADYKAILEALIFAERHGLKPVILGGRDAWKLADLLAERRVPVIYDAIFSLPSTVENVPAAGDSWDANYIAAGKLARAGVQFCFANRDAALAKNVLNEAGFAVAHGLDQDAALRALTLSPAEILGVADRLGSLEKGKVADVVITSGHLLQATSRVTHLFVAGVPVSLESKHSRDAKQFAERPDVPLPSPRSDLKGMPSQSSAPQRP